MYKHTDYFKKYGRIMQFNKNKKEPFHRWYPFVEGYSKEFIQSIVKEMDRNNLVCLEPFSGSGTTALELQNCGIACFAFEVNPLMYLIARVKLENGYELERFEYWYSCFQKTRTMQAKLDVLKPISGIREVFAHFIVECVYKKDNYNICFDYLSGKVKAEIKEQDLRNILLQYLEKNMRGEVSVEFCTDYLNDEESVDIYIYDGCQRAIIEVKFSLPEKYYAGSTHYSITARTGDGIKQLDKYARHLAKDGRLVDFGYVYMFYMSDVKKETLMSRIDNKTNELLRGLSDELNSIFDGVEMNDMKCWGTAS